MQAVLPGMRDRKSGTIVNISSISGLRALPCGSIYAASKHALEGTSESLAQEIAPFNIRILIVEPGAFCTNFLGQDATWYQPLRNEYRGTLVDSVLDRLRRSDGKQQGDPEKGAERIYEVVMGEGMAKGRPEYLRLPLGAEGLKNARAKANQLMETFDALEDIALSTSFEED